jgi:hypothetical protein
VDAFELWNSSTGAPTWLTPRIEACPKRRLGARGDASRTIVKQVDTTRLMMVLVDDCDAGVGDLHGSDLRRLTLGREHRRGWSDPRPVG